MNILFRLVFFFLISITVSQHSFAQVQADFSINHADGCSPTLVQFTNKTTGATTNAVYHWDFGNGNASSLSDGSAVYVIAQSYTITLTVTDGAKTSSKSAQFIVHKNPAIDFSASVNKGCLPLPVTFTATPDAGSGSITDYAWDFGDGNTIQNNTAIQPHIYTSIQNPKVSLTVTDQFGCHTTIEKTGLVNVLPGVMPEIKADKNFLCLVTDPVQFTNTSTGPGTLSYIWDFGDGNTSTQKNPQYVFNTKGTYTVKLQVTSSEGCVANTTLTNTLNVASFKPDFTVPSSICMGQEYTLSNNSIPSADKSLWSVDGIYNGQTADLVFNANVSGSHAISLTNTYGACLQTVTKNVVVNDLPSPAGFSYTEQGKCGPPEIVIFKDNSNAAQQEWDFNYNYYEPHITSTEQQPGNYYPDISNYHFVWLRSTSAAGCSITTIQTINLTPQRVYIYSDGPVSTCGTPNTEQFTCSRTDLASYLWDFGDGTTSTEIAPVHTYNDIGHYNVHLKYTTNEGCSDSSSNWLTFYVSIPLQIDFTASQTTVCGNSYVTFGPINNDPQNAVWSTFFFGDGTWDVYSGHAYDKPGKYSITYNVQSPGCFATLTKTDFITVVPPFFSITGTEHSCDGDRGIVTFLGKSSGADRLIWDFGDGTTETTTGDLISEFKHNYLQDGYYTLNVTAVNDQGCSLPRDFPVSVIHKNKPTLSLDKNKACPDDLLNSHITYNLSPGSPLFWSGFWVRYEYGDGTPYTGDVQSPYSIWGESYEGTIKGFETGKQNIRAITTTAITCYDTSNFVPLDIRGVKAAFDIVQDHSCFQTPVILKDASVVDPGNSIVSWSWDFSDGTILNNSGTVNHTYVHPGSYPVKLTVTDAIGCSATSSDNATTNVVTNGPEAVFTCSATNVALNTTINFYNTSNTFGSTNTGWLWKFSDDGSSSTDFSPVHTYPVAGDYTVTLISTDAITGCSSSMSQKIHVSNFNSAFNSNASYVSGNCLPVLVNFNNESVNFLKVHWDFGDGVSSENPDHASHIYKDTGRFVVTMTVFGPNNLQDQITDTVIVKAPAASLLVNPYEACIGSNVKDSAKAVNTNNYLWDFGDGSVSNTTIPSATHQYLNSGIYKPKLLVQDINGCISAALFSGEINIHPNPTPVISPGNSVLCQGSVLPIEANGGFTYKWTPSTGLSNDAIANPLASPLASTTYLLEIADELGCKNSASITVNVILPGNLTANRDTAVCQGVSVQLNAFGETVYNWIDNTDGLNSTSIANPVASPQTTTTYTVTGTDANNCFPDTASFTIRILPLPVVDAGMDTTVQAGDNFNLRGAGSNDIIQWNWSPAKYLSCTDCPSPACTTKENISYTLTAKNQDGCIASDQVIIKLECDEARISIPNAFTPNRDHLNDQFVVKGISLIKHMVIYDRYGARVFERNNFNPADPASCWDGNQNGMPVVTGVYVYFIEMECPAGGAFSRKGTVVLIR